MSTKRAISKHDRLVIGTTVSVILLIVMTFVYLATSLSDVDLTISEESLAQSHTMLSYNLIEIERAAPIFSMILYFLVNIAGALYVTYLTSRLSFYPVVTRYPIVIFCATSIGISCYEPYKLLSAVTLLVSLLAIGNMLSVNEERTSGYSQTSGASSATTSSTARIFGAIFYLGLLALLYPSAVVLWVVAPFLLFFYGREIPELLMLIVATLLPIALEWYARWVMGCPLGESADHFLSLLLGGGSFPIISPHMLWGMICDEWLLFLQVLLLSLLSAVGIIRLGSVSLSARVVQRYSALITVWILMLIMFLSSAFVASSWVMMTIPITILSTLALITMRSWITTIMISTIVALTIGSIILS